MGAALAPELDKRVNPTWGMAGLSLQHMGSLPRLQPKFQQQAGVEEPSLLGTHPAKPRAGGVTSRGQAVLRPNSIWQTMPIGNQCPSLGGFNFMVVCTNLQPLMAGQSSEHPPRIVSRECDVFSAHP